MEEVYNDKNPYPNAPGYPSNKEANGPTRVSDKNEQQHIYDERGHIYSTDSSDNLLAAAGVRRIEAINEQFTTVDRWIVFFMIAAAAQPTAAKIADVFGRIELIIVSVVFYVVGTIVEATSDGVSQFSGGAVLYQIGYTMIILLVEVIVADLTSTRSRLFFSFVPALPFVVSIADHLIVDQMLMYECGLQINTWVSGDITSAVLSATTWNWGVGMWAIIYPVCTLPLLFMLFLAQHRAHRAGTLRDYKSPFAHYGAVGLVKELFWQLDVIGIILMIAVFALILVPLTLAGGVAAGAATWRQAHIIAPLVVGFCCIPFFVWWEMKARYPLVPFHLLKNRGVWAGFGIACTLNFAWSMQAGYLYPVLIVAFNQSVKSATRITSLYSFASVITGTLLGLVVYKVRRLKPFIIFGCCLFMVAFGLLIHYRGGLSGSSKAGIIGAEIVLGIAGGCFSYPTQASVQVETRHEHLAVVTGLYLATYNIGSALGSCVSGAIWSQELPKQIEKAIGGNSTLAAEIYGSPYTWIITNPVGTPDRDAVNHAYQHVQRILCIVGICLCVPLIAFSLLLKNPRLTGDQSLKTAEKEADDRSSTGDD
ncbi:hypothetical protein QFC24_006888 [Naganishia onofrii]|uniref:Uncharacterized protein n=1 Tax=Naganishia onofrii TaxID=1851511 RepID=A0ACC2WVG5_9TREE|nr:hypothetical protein QFC24_006888 [Naganishia onofrii]